MKKQILFAGAIWLGLLSIQGPALADNDDWHRKYDHDNDGKWDYNDFNKAHRDWEHDRNMKYPKSDKWVKQNYNHLDKNHDGYVSPEEARRFHHWQ